VSDNGGWTTINLDPRLNAAAAVWEGLPDVIGLAAGAGHNLLLTRDGSAIASGDNDCGQADVPAGLTDVVAVAAGYGHSLALRRDGTVVAWGNNARGATDVPADLTDVTAIAGGGGHSVALRSDGTVVAWGQVGRGPADPPADLADVVAIASGWETCYALKSDGTVASWGGDTYGSRDGDIVGIAVGGEVESFCLGTKPDGSVTRVGFSMSMALNQVPEGLRGVTNVAIGGMHCMALLDTGTVIGWGGSPVRHTVPTGLADVTAISAGENHTLALRTDGTVVAWGKNGCGQIQPPDGHTARIVGWVDGVGYVLPGSPSAVHDYSPEYGAHPTTSTRGAAGSPTTCPSRSTLSNSADAAPSKSQVEILGSTQSGFINMPTIKVFWNGKHVGRVEHGGRFTFDIETEGEVRFKYLFRSASLRIKPGSRTRVQLSWDRASGKLIAARSL
jgi:hypothetical protein